MVVAGCRIVREIIRQIPVLQIILRACAEIIHT